MSNKKNRSINTQFNELSTINQHSLEILTKFNQALTSNTQFVTVTQEEPDGSKQNAQIPTLNTLFTEIETIKKAIRILTGVDGTASTIKLSDNEFKRIIVADINKEPSTISTIGNVSQFSSDPNYFLDNLLSPIISIPIDLTNIIDADVRTVKVRRYIVTPEKVINNGVVSLTADATIAINQFNNKYKGKNNIDLVEFETWLSTTNGLVNKFDTANTLVDERLVRIEPNSLIFRGDFTVLSTSTDVINKKVYYVLNTLNYYNISNKNNILPIELKVGDYLNVNPNVAGVKATTVYKIIEVITDGINNKIVVETLFGDEPIPVRLNALSFYSDKVPTRTLKVDIGFDEYNVVFLRPVDDNNNLIAKAWSTGVGYFTNDLTLDVNGTTFTNYYVNTILDYGKVLADLVVKKIPQFYASKPNAPVLNLANFKVVQTNKHLTDTVDAEKVRDLHNQKNSLISEITQVQQAIDKKNRFIQTQTFVSAADRKRADNELSTLTTKLKTKTDTKNTVVQDILARKKNINGVTATYAVRGFFPIPPAVENSKTRPQEVVQFEIWYRRKSKSGSENPIQTFTGLDNSANIKTLSIINPDVLNINPPASIVNATFSNWVKYKTDARKRIFDAVKGEYFWQLEDISSADTPTINQVDIPVEVGESIEIKVIALSEVGFPEHPTESDFSNVIVVPFPDDLTNITTEDDFILKEASTDNATVQFNKQLDSLGLTQHLSTAFRVDDIYYPHSANAIASGFKDNAGKIQNLYDKILSMENEISTLQAQLSLAKGSLQVFIVNKGVRQQIPNTTNIQLNINLEDYYTKTKIGTITNPIDNVITRTFKNELSIIDDYSIEIVNPTAGSILGIISSRFYGASSSAGQATPFSYDNSQTGGVGNPFNFGQGVWINSGGKLLFYDDVNGVTGVNAQDSPRYKSQRNNQYVWLEHRSIDNTPIYGSYRGNVLTAGQNSLPEILNESSVPPLPYSSDLYNAGASINLNMGLDPAVTGSGQTTFQSVGATLVSNISDPHNFTTKGLSQGTLVTTVHPITSDLLSLIDTSSALSKALLGGDTNKITIPLRIYYMPYSDVYVNKIPAIPTIPNTQSTIWNQAVGADSINLTISGSTSVGGNLQISVPGTPTNYIKIGDKLTFINSGTIKDNMVLKVNNISGNNIILDTPYISITTGNIIHIHVLNTNITPPLSSNSSTELHSYSVIYDNSQIVPYITNYIEIVNSNAVPSPIVHNKKVRFYLESELSARAVEFQIQFNITHYKPILSNTNTVNNLLSISSL